MDITLSAEIGRPTGSRSSKRLRAEGKVPAVVYGLDREPVAVVVQWSELRRALNTEAGLNALITLEVGGESELTIVKDLQRAAVRRSVEHVDFLRIDRNAMITVDVPIVLHGESKELEMHKGIIEQTLHSLTVSARPGSIPTQLDADVSDLDIGGSIHVRDLTLPEGVTTDLDPDDVVALGTGTRGDVEAADEAAAAAASAESDASAAEAADND